MLALGSSQTWCAGRGRRGRGLMTSSGSYELVRARGAGGTQAAEVVVDAEEACCRLCCWCCLGHSQSVSEIWLRYERHDRSGEAHSGVARWVVEVGEQGDDVPLSEG